MPKRIIHRRVGIVTLEPGERIADHCEPEEIALVPGAEGWWVHFVADDGTSETYDEAFESHDKAMWAAKAAAEFSSSL